MLASTAAAVPAAAAAEVLAVGAGSSLLRHHLVNLETTRQPAG
jgi:hypothetical protein